MSAMCHVACGMWMLMLDVDVGGAVGYTALVFVAKRHIALGLVFKGGCVVLYNSRDREILAGTPPVQ